MGAAIAALLQPLTHTIVNTHCDNHPLLKPNQDLVEARALFDSCLQLLDISQYLARDGC